MPKEQPEARLSDGVGFVSINPNFSDSSAQLMDFVRATLKHAQEITATVDTAERTADEAWTCVSGIEVDSAWMNAEVARLLTAPGTGKPPGEAAAAASFKAAPDAGKSP